MLNEQQGVIKIPRGWLHCSLFSWNISHANEKETTASRKVKSYTSSFLFRQRGKSCEILFDDVLHSVILWNTCLMMQGYIAFFYVI